MDTYKPLHCDLHDYLEIACLCGYTLDIELTDGQRLTARAITTRISSTREEFLEVDTGDGRREIRLDQLLAIAPLDKNARSGRVVLASDQQVAWITNGGKRSAVFHPTRMWELCRVDNVYLSTSFCD